MDHGCEFGTYVLLRLCPIKLLWSNIHQSALARMTNIRHISLKNKLYELVISVGQNKLGQKIWWTCKH
jgi:hypothetical protein